MGPVVSEAQYQKVLNYIQIASDEGAELLLGGNAMEIDGCPGGFFVEPTVFGNVTSNMRIAQEEVFGPILSLMPYDDLDDAIEIANSDDLWTHWQRSGPIITSPRWNYPVALKLGYVWVTGLGTITVGNLMGL